MSLNAVAAGGADGRFPHRTPALGRDFGHLLPMVRSAMDATIWPAFRGANPGDQSLFYCLEMPIKKGSEGRIVSGS